MLIHVTRSGKIFGNILPAPPPQESRIQTDVIWGTIYVKREEKRGENEKKGMCKKRGNRKKEKINMKVK
jgi:hypothetical protein